MKWIAWVFAFILSTSAWTRTSKVVPAFLEAAEVYVNSNHLDHEDGTYLRPDIRAVYQILKEKDVSKNLLQTYLEKYQKSFDWELDHDHFDEWISDSQIAPISNEDVPEIALHAVKIDVFRASDVFFKDSVYAYYFITDGLIPTAKVTSIYKGIGSGQGFFFNETDRAIFPLAGIPAKRPDNHLIVDYGIIESDGDDIKELQKISSIIIDIAIAVYTHYHPENGQVLKDLREEVKKLASLLLQLNSDDRLATGSFGYKASELKDLLSQTTFVEFKKNHKKVTNFESWEYEISFRLLRK